MSSRASPWLELGFSVTALFGGGDRSVTAQTVLDVFTARNEDERDLDEDAGDHRSAVDARVLLPFEAQPIELYGELAGQDEGGGLFSNLAYVAGVYLPRLADLSWLGLTVEVADTSVGGEGGTWYESDDFPDGFTHEENVLGHHVGGDGFDLFVSAEIRPGADWRCELSWDYEQHRLRDAVSERVHQFRLTVEKRLTDRLRLRAFLAHDRWRNFGQRFGDDASGGALGVALLFSL